MDAEEPRNSWVGVVSKLNSTNSTRENSEHGIGYDLPEESIGAYLSKDMSLSQLKRDRRRAFSYVVEHSGFAALLVSFVAFFLGFLYYVFQCGRAWLFGISFESIGQMGSSSLFTVALCIAIASLFLLSNYLAYNKIRSQESGFGVAKSIAKYFFVSFVLVTVAITVLAVVEISVSSLPSSSAESSIDVCKTLGLLILMALSFMLMLFFIGGAQGFIEWRQHRRIEQESHGGRVSGFRRRIRKILRQKSNQKPEKNPESKSGYKRVGEEIMLWMVSFGLVTAGAFIMGFTFSVTLFVPRIVVPAYGQNASSIVVFETPDKYCLEKFEEVDGVLVIDRSHQEWVASNSVEIEIRSKAEIRFRE